MATNLSRFNIYCHILLVACHFIASVLKDPTLLKALRCSLLSKYKHYCFATIFVSYYSDAIHDQWVL